MLSGFALAWFLMGSGEVTGAAVAIVVGLAITLGTVLLALRAAPAREGRSPREVDAGWRRRFNRVGTVQWLTIAVAVVGLAAAGAPGVIPGAICLIVGLHFFPLARIFERPEYAATGAALCLVAVAGFATDAGDGAEAARAVVGLGAAATLWATAAFVARRG